MNTTEHDNAISANKHCLVGADTHRAQQALICTRAWKKIFKSVQSELNLYFNLSVPAILCIIIFPKPVWVEKYRLIKKFVNLFFAYNNNNNKVFSLLKNKMKTKQEYIWYINPLR